jgi:hypothetical protein
LEAIFNYRAQAITKLFGKGKERDFSWQRQQRGELSEPQA